MECVSSCPAQVQTNQFILFSFMKDFKKLCLGTGGNQEFWKEVKKVGQQLSLISDVEADQHGGTSTVSEKTALKVRTFKVLSVALKRGIYSSLYECMLRL